MISEEETLQRKIKRERQEANKDTIDNRENQENYGKGSGDE